MNIFDTALPDVKIIEPEAHGDERGFFMETFRDNWFREHIGHHTFVQENHSRSEHGVLRGLHYQTVCPQGKLVRVVAGSVFDVAVDLRRSSPTFGHWVGAVLSAENRYQMWIPPGFAHGFCGGVVGFVLDREEGLLLEVVVFGVFHGHLCSSSKTLFNSLRASFEALSLKLRWAR